MRQRRRGSATDPACMPQLRAAMGSGKQRLQPSRAFHAGGDDRGPAHPAIDGMGRQYPTRLKVPRTGDCLPLCGPRWRRSEHANELGALHREIEPMRAIAVKIACPVIGAIAQFDRGNIGAAGEHSSRIVEPGDFAPTFLANDAVKCVEEGCNLLHCRREHGGLGLLLRA